MKPVIAIIGRPNVGKSTLFNRLTRSRNALVADVPGVTRDRQYGFARHNRHEIIVIDTGGLGDHDNATDTISGLITGQTFQAIDEADAIIWLLDGIEGMTAEDQELAIQLRPYNKSVYLAVNKAEGKEDNSFVADFHSLGMGDPFAISAIHGKGINDLLDVVTVDFNPDESTESNPENGTRLVVLGKPNVGKSTLVNRILGEDRVLASEQPGTTRDSIRIKFNKKGKDYILIDTAGVRRKSKVNDTIEKFSIVKTLKSIEEADIIILVLDAQDSISEQDAKLLGLAVECGKSLVITVNKWDGLERSEKIRIRSQLDRKLGFIQYACIHFISALHGSGIGKIFNSVDKIEKSIHISPPTSKLTNFLHEIIEAHPPSVVRGRRIKLRYAHLGGHNPLRIIIHGNQTEQLGDEYRRYLANAYRKKLKLTGTPVLVEFKRNENPYKNRINQPANKKIQKQKRIDSRLINKKR